MVAVEFREPFVSPPPAGLMIICQVLFWACNWYLSWIFFFFPPQVFFFSTVINLYCNEKRQSFNLALTVVTLGHILIVDLFYTDTCQLASTCYRAIPVVLYSDLVQFLIVQIRTLFQPDRVQLEICDFIMSVSPIADWGGRSWWTERSKSVRASHSYQRKGNLRNSDCEFWGLSMLCINSTHVFLF